MDKMTPSTREGQSLVEFALILPVFLLIAVVIFDLGRAVYYTSALQNAAREGARYSAVHPDDETGMKDAIINYAVGLGLNLDNITDNIEFAGLDPDWYETVGDFATPTFRVTLVYYFTPVTPLVSQFFPAAWHGNIRLKSEAVMRTEYFPESIP